MSNSASPINLPSQQEPTTNYWGGGVASMENSQNNNQMGFNDNINKNGGMFMVGQQQNSQQIGLGSQQQQQQQGQIGQIGQNNNNNSMQGSMGQGGIGNIGQNNGSIGQSIGNIGQNNGNIGLNGQNIGQIGQNNLGQNNIGQVNQPIGNNAQNVNQQQNAHNHPQNQLPNSNLPPHFRNSHNQSPTQANSSSPFHMFGNEQIPDLNNLGNSQSPSPLPQRVHTPPTTSSNMFGFNNMGTGMNTGMNPGMNKSNIGNTQRGSSGTFKVNSGLTSGSDWLRTTNSGPNSAASSPQRPISERPLNNNNNAFISQQTRNRVTSTNSNSSSTSNNIHQTQTPPNGVAGSQNLMNKLQSVPNNNQTASSVFPNQLNRNSNGNSTSSNSFQQQFAPLNSPSNPFDNDLLPIKTPPPNSISSASTGLPTNANQVPAQTTKSNNMSSSSNNLNSNNNSMNNNFNSKAQNLASLAQFNDNHSKSGLQNMGSVTANPLNTQTNTTTLSSSTQQSATLTNSSISNHHNSGSSGQPTTPAAALRSQSVPHGKNNNKHFSPKPHVGLRTRIKDPFNAHRRDVINRNNQDETRWYTLRIQGNVRNLSPVLWRFTHLTRLDMKNNIIKKIPNEISNLKSLMQLDISYNMIKTLPNSLGKLLELRELNVSHNRINTLPNAIGRLFNLQSLSLENNTGDAMNQYHSCIRGRDNGLKLLIAHLYQEYLNQWSNMPNYTHQQSISPTEKPQRDWRTLNIDPSAEQRIDTSTQGITVMTYNILSDKYATSQQYGYCPEWALDWTYRRDRLLDDITNYSPDIVCLQEIEKQVYEKEFEPALGSQVGYQSIYSQKGRAKTMHPDQQEHVDGCAIFYNAQHMKPVLQMTVNFTRIACKVVDGREHQEQLINRTMTKDNIGLLVLFEMHSNIGTPPRHILIANAHLHWDPEFCDIKLVQTIILMNAIHKMRLAATANSPDELKEDAEHMKKLYGGDSKKSLFCDADFDVKVLDQLPIAALQNEMPDQIPVIVAGDFNSLPDSGVLDFVTNGSVNTAHADFLGYGWADHFQNLRNHRDTITRAERNNVEPKQIQIAKKQKILHCLDLDSAYGQFAEETPFSNFTYGFKGMIDYIFYSKHLLHLTGVLPGVKEKWFEDRNIPGCPFISIPSDHLPLLSEFRIYKRNIHNQMHGGGMGGNHGNFGVARSGSGGGNSGMNGWNNSSGGHGRNGGSSGGGGGGGGNNWNNGNNQNNATDKFPSYNNKGNQW